MTEEWNQAKGKNPTYYISWLNHLSVAIRDKISCCVPVYREDHFFDTTLDLILGFQVSHSLRRLTINGNNNVANTEAGLGCFTSWGYLVNKVGTINFYSSATEYWYQG